VRVPLVTLFITNVNKLKVEWKMLPKKISRLRYHAKMLVECVRQFLISTSICKTKVITRRLKKTNKQATKTKL
jgi:hypothetical protein